MKNTTGMEPFIKNDWVSHVEIASVNFDQWVLTVALRAYEKNTQKVGGMIHVIFEEVEGFRVLDEGKMLSYPWQLLKPDEHFVHCVPNQGWLDLESNADNMVLSDEAKEYVIVTGNECVSVIAYAPPVIPASANKALQQTPKSSTAEL